MLGVENRKIMFPGVISYSLVYFFCKMYHLVTKRRQTDRQMDGRTDNSIMPTADHWLMIDSIQAVHNSHAIQFLLHIFIYSTLYLQLLS